MIILDVIDDRRSKNQPPAPPFDPWADWKPDWINKKKKKTPHSQQEAHSPTEDVKVRVSADRSLSVTRRRIVDARLWESMTPEQQDAALWIAAAYEMIGRGMGYVTSNWKKIPGCKSPGDALAAQGKMVESYVRWAQACPPRKISHSLIVDILCFGFSCRMVDRDRRLRSGAARENLMQGLDLYGELAGWNRRGR